MDINATSGYGDEDWDAEFKAEKEHINDLIHANKPFLALQYIMTSFFNLLGRYNESYRMGSQAKIENVLSELQQARNKIETDFDACQNSKNTAAAQDAINQYKQIAQLLKDNEISPNNPNGVFTSDFVNSVLSEFSGSSTSGTIFQTSSDPSTLDPSTLAATWNGLWQGPSGGNPPLPNQSPNIQGVTNALTAVSTDFSSQSSIAQSKLKYYETWDEQFMTVQHSMMSEYINQEKAPNTGMQSAAS